MGEGDLNSVYKWSQVIDITSHDEFITTSTTDPGGVTLLEPCANLFQEQITVYRPQVVIDAMESIDIDQQQTKDSVTRDQLLYVLIERQPVGQLSQGVNQLMLQQPLLGPGQFGDVRQQHHRAPGLAAIGGRNDHLDLTVFLMSAVQCHY